MEQKLDKNDTALIQYFLRGMRRFAKHVRAQGEIDNKTPQQRIDAAYFLAYGQFLLQEDK